MAEVATGNQTRHSGVLQGYAEAVRRYRSDLSSDASESKSRHRTCAGLRYGMAELPDPEDPG